MKPTSRSSVHEELHKRCAVQRADMGYHWNELSRQLVKPDRVVGTISTVAKTISYIPGLFVLYKTVSRLFGRKRSAPAD